MYQYFAYDPDVGFETFKTKQEAIDFANSVIDEYRENSGDGWDEIVGQVCWGEIKQQAMMTDEQPAPPESGFDYTCDYALGVLPTIGPEDGAEGNAPSHEWTDAQCLEFLSVAFRHCEIKGDVVFDEIRQGVSFALAAAKK